MADEEPTNPEHAGPRFRIRFSLVALFIFITLVCIVLAWMVQPKRVVVTALFEIARENLSLTAERSSPRAIGDDFENLKQTQLALLKEDYVLKSAVRNPAIAGLRVLQTSDDPVAWLKNHLEVGFPENSEILEIKLRGTKSQAPDLVLLVDSVADAYKKEVLAAQMQRRQGERDLIEQSLQDLNKDIKRKYDDYLEIAKQLGSLDSDSGAVRQQLDTKRLDRIDNELADLERAQLKNGEGGEQHDTRFVSERMAQLRKRQAELEKSITDRSHPSSELSFRKHELEQLQHISDDLIARVSRLDIDLNSPQRIRQIQQAQVTKVASGPIR